MNSGRGRSHALVTYSLILANAVAFTYELSLARELEPFLYRWGTVSQEVREYLAEPQASPAVLITLLSAMFLHAGWVHLAANMLYLWIFGERVEQALGSARLLALYLVAGVFGGMGQVIAAPGVLVPAVGASAAVAGAIGAYLALQPGSTMAALAPRLFYRRTADMSAALLLALWLVAQAFVGLLAIAEPSQAQALGWWAHLGGFSVGVFWGSLASRSQRASAGFALESPNRTAEPRVGGIERVEKAQHEWGNS